MRRPAPAVVERRAIAAAEETQVEQLQVHLDCATRAQRVCIVPTYSACIYRIPCFVAIAIAWMTFTIEGARRGRHLTLAQFVSVEASIHAKRSRATTLCGIHLSLNVDHVNRLDKDPRCCR